MQVFIQEETSKCKFLYKKKVVSKIMVAISKTGSVKVVSIV